MARKYPDPWVPRTFQAWVVKQTRVQRVTDRASGEVRRRNVDCWDVKGKCDGVQWFKRFHKAGLAETWRERAERDFTRGLPFDLKTKQFVEPQAPTGPVAPSVFALTELYFHQHPEWEPATKEAAARSFNRARRWLLVPGVELTGDDLVAVEDYLDHASFLPARLEGRITDRQRAGQRWLEAHSAPADSLSSSQIEAFVSLLEVSERKPGTRLSAATLTRYLQPLRAAWNWAIARDDLPIDRSPWVVVRARRKVKGKATLAAGRAGLAVDADIVLSVSQSLALAEACVTEGAWGGVVECFVLVMALCGLRPGEAAGLVSEDLELPPADEPGWLVVRRTHRPTRDRWLDPDEDPEWGPLKDRDLTESRRVPVPSLLVANSVNIWSSTTRAPAGSCSTATEEPSSAAGSPSACGSRRAPSCSPAGPTSHPTTPANPNSRAYGATTCAMPPAPGGYGRESMPVVCQRWSGHRTLSVFLDIYQGVAPGREDRGVRRLEQSLRGAA